MPERFSRRILDHLADQRYKPRTVEDLAGDLQVPKDQRDLFRQAVEDLLEDGQVVLGSSDTVGLPPPGKEMVGAFRLHERGFGFIVPDAATEHGDLFVPPGSTSDAMSGDRVRAKVIHEKGRGGGGKSPYVGKIVEVVQRADRKYVGTLEKRGKNWVVDADGRAIHNPVIVRDVGAKNAHKGDKVVLELVEYPDRNSNEWPEGVIVEVLGDAGQPDVETLAVMRAFGLPETFADEVMDTAREASHALSGDAVPEDREDLTDVFTTTIDPPDARDFDDAISIRQLEPEATDGGGKGKGKGKKNNKTSPVYELGVHIADVSHFVRPGTPLDDEARQRGNSTYLPRRVIPMLPELLSNGVCSLQEGVNRYTKSCFIQYDAKGNVVGQRFARTVIRSDKRMTYLEAQALIDGDLDEAVKHNLTEAKYPRELVHTVKLMDELAKIIRKRRMKEGMIVLGLPAVELEFDETGRVTDAHPEDDAFTHTIIEMFMVEANEAAARLFDSLDVPMIRRIHPDPDAHDVSELRQFARVAGLNIPARPSRKELQTLLESARGKPGQQAVHLAVLKTLSKAEYSPMLVGHFALASEHYTHFTSPIRRYPDLIVHRGLDAAVEAIGDKPVARRKKKIKQQLDDDDRLMPEEALHEIGQYCSNTERNSEAAERVLRNYLVLEYLADHLGDDYEGTVTGVISRGAFVELDKYLVDGFVPVDELPGPKKERWQLNRTTGALVAQRSGKSVTIGHRFKVRIAKVDLSKRQMELVIVEEEKQEKHQSSKSGKSGKHESGKSQKQENRKSGQRKGGKGGGKPNSKKKETGGKKGKSKSKSKNKGHSGESRRGRERRK